MKKILKLTLFKKIFLIIFVGMLSVESFHVYLDFRAEINSLYYMTYDESSKLLGYESRIKKVVDYCVNKYDFELSRKFLITYSNIYKDSHGFFAIVRDNEIKVEVDNVSGPNIPLMRGSNEDYFEVDINLKDVDKDVINKLNQYIYKCYQADKTQVICIDMALPKVEREDEMTTLKLKPTYLKFGNVKYSTQNHGEVKNFVIKNYDSNEYSYGHYFENGEMMLDYKKTIDRFRRISIGNEKQSSIGEIRHLDSNRTIHYFFINDSLWIHESETIDNTQFVEIYPTIITKGQIMYKIINAKLFVYPLAILLTFFMSILISYMLTRRIKKIDKTTQSIADGNFDLLLNEKSKDEIGRLSHSINMMSQQLKKTIEQLNDEIEHVKELESLRKEFINQFTHEMKTPLGIINGYSELLDDAQSEEEKEKYLQIINRETNHINKLIESMLNLSRLEADKVQLNLDNLDLEDIITEIVDEYEVLLMKKEVKVDIKTIDPYIQGDKELMKTVIHNFLSNAIKHVNQGGCINIEIDQGCSVYNEGDLIDEKHLKNIWHTFVTHDQQGSGLGLAICSSILELHELDYGVYNVKNGVCFYFKKS